MIKRSSPLAAAATLLILPVLGAAPAEALSLVTFVSGNGTDTGICAAPANPCRSFQFAVNQTSPSGEVKALDPAHYGAVTITKSMSITGIEGAGILRTLAGSNAVTINAGPKDTINLSHLTLDGFKIAKNGIVLNSGGSLTITNCTVRDFQTGLLLQPAGTTKFLIGNSLVSDNPSNGILVQLPGTGSAQGSLDHVSINRNGNGLEVVGSTATFTAVDSMATNNSNFGFFAAGLGVLRLAHSTATGNSTGIFVESGSTVESFVDNYIRGNAKDVDGILIKVGSR